MFCCTINWAADRSGRPPPVDYQLKESIYDCLSINEQNKCLKRLVARYVIVHYDRPSRIIDLRRNRCNDHEIDIIYDNISRYKWRVYVEIYVYIIHNYIYTCLNTCKNLVHVFRLLIMTNYWIFFYNCIISYNFIISYI